MQDPYNTQNFNRYGYVLNNPLLYTDPSGELAWFVPVIIGAALAAATYTITALTADVPFTAGGLIKATVIGAFSAAVTYGIGEATAVIPQLGTRIAVEAVAHGLFQGAMAGVQGGDFWQGFASGALASVAASLYGGGKMAGGDGYWDGLGGKFGATGAGQIAFGTISGGAGAALTGGNFWQGAATGFVVSALNHAFHNKKPDPPNDKYKRYFAQKLKESQSLSDNLFGGSSNSTASAAVPIALTAAAIDGPIPIGDIVGGLILTGAATYDLSQRIYLTYTLRNSAGQVYAGRASGFGSPYSIMMRRYASHHMRVLGYGNPTLDVASQGYPMGYYAIRGREQQLIDFFGGVGSPNVGNSINAISPYNPRRYLYMNASNVMFGPLK